MSITKPRTSSDYYRRLKVMKDLRASGLSYRQIGEAVKLSRQRVQQIFHIYIDDSSGGLGRATGGV